MSASIRLVFVSDTHGFHDFPVPPGDVLVHAGDGCIVGTLEEASEWAAFLRRQPHPHKIVIAGNHDRCFEAGFEQAKALFEDFDFLHDSGCERLGLSFWGSPWQPWFFDWAFNLPRGPQLAAKWALIPELTDVLITHAPPHGILDECYDGALVGCEELRKALDRVRPRVHVFGHIHEAYGTTHVGQTLFINASICTLRYRPTNPAIVVDLPLDRSQPAILVE